MYFSTKKVHLKTQFSLPFPCIIIPHLIQKKNAQYDNCVFKSQYGQAVPVQPAGGDTALCRKQGLGDRPVGDGSGKRKPGRKRPQAGAPATADEAGRHAHRDRGVAPEPHADRHHGHHGALPGERHQALHHEGGIFVRQFHQQQGALLRLRAGGGDRAQPYLPAYPRGACPAEGGRRGAGAENGKLYQAPDSGGEPHFHCRYARRRQVGGGNMQAFSRVEGHVRPVPERESRSTEGIECQGKKKEKEKERMTV